MMRTSPNSSTRSISQQSWLTIPRLVSVGGGPGLRVNKIGLCRDRAAMISMELVTVLLV
jgi:hypothetical protein